MKAKYVKPDLLVESFTLMQNIASECTVPTGSTLGHPTQSTRATCAWSLGNVALWLESMDACSIKTGEYEDVNGICYNAPSTGLSIFGS